MTSRDHRFRRAAWAYFVYGVIYWGGALYLAAHGIGQRGMAGRGGLSWFVLGGLFVIVFPWLIARGARHRGYLWFSRILSFLMAYRAFEVGRVALRPKIPTVPFPGGGEVGTAIGAWLFFLITLIAIGMLARAAWGRS